MIENQSLRSKSVLALLNAKPPFIEKWGLYFFLMVFCLLVIATWFIPYNTTMSEVGIIESYKNNKYPVIYISAMTTDITNGMQAKLVVDLSSQQEKVVEGRIDEVTEIIRGHQYSVTFYPKNETNFGLKKLPDFKIHLKIKIYVQKRERLLTAIFKKIKQKL